MKKKFSLAGALKKISFFILSLVIFLVLLALISEGALRIFILVKNRLYPPDRNFEKYLGWQTKPNDKWVKNLPGYGVISYSTGPYGFRVCGDLKTKKKKIFVIGDSNTQARQVSDGETYYDYLKKHNKNIELFVYGCEGYGTLQEYMILDRYFDLIKPDLILWQFCGNDLNNNYHELESASIGDNNQMTRPYLENGRIKWLFPAYLKGYNYWFSKNFFVIRLFQVYSGISGGKHKFEKDFNYDYRDPRLQEAFKVTKNIFNLVNIRKGKIPLAIFVVFGDDEWLQKACQGLGYSEILGIVKAIEKERNNGKKIDGYPFDGHLNRAGHAIIGKTILEYLEKNKLI